MSMMRAKSVFKLFLFSCFLEVLRTSGIFVDCLICWRVIRDVEARHRHEEHKGSFEDIQSQFQCLESSNTMAFGIL